MLIPAFSAASLGLPPRPTKLIAWPLNSLGPLAPRRLPYFRRGGTACQNSWDVALTRCRRDLAPPLRVVGEGWGGVKQPRDEVQARRQAPAVFALPGSRLRRRLQSPSMPHSVRAWRWFAAAATRPGCVPSPRMARPCGIGNRTGCAASALRRRMM